MTTVVVRSLWAHITLKKVSSCYKEYKVQNIPISVLQLSLSVSMYDRRQQSNLLQNIRMQSMAFYLSCVLIVIVLGFVCISPAHTAVSPAKVYFVGLPGQDGRAGPSVSFPVSHLLSIWWERALQPEHFLTAGLGHRRLRFLSNSSLHSALEPHRVPAQQRFNFGILKPAGAVRMEYFKQQKRHLV